MTVKPPPADLDLVYCPECGKTNRYSALFAYDPTLSRDRDFHYGEGSTRERPKRCYGKPIRLTYRLDEATLPGGTR